MRTFTIILAGVLLSAPPSRIALSQNQREPGDAGVIRVWGNDRMRPLMTQWEEGFRHRHGGVRFETRLLGTGTAVAGLYTGVADVALMGRPVDSTESMAFEWVFRYKPFTLEATTGSVGVPGKSYAPAILVARTNPITRLTLAELDAVFGCELRRGARAARTWGDLGLTGEWAARPIHAYSPDLRGATAVFFRDVVLKGSYKWRCDLRELVDRRMPDGSRREADEEVADAVSQDVDGIGYSALAYANARLKPVAIALDEGGPSYLPTAETVQSRQYPLSRATWIVVNRRPDQPLDPLVAEFVRYVLSRDGQEVVAREGDYLPLPGNVAANQLRQLP